MKHSSGSRADKETFGDRVRAARHLLSSERRRTVDQKELAALLSVAPATVSSWETGGKEPSYATVTRLARILGVRAAWLAFGEEPMRDEDLGTIQSLAREFPNHGAKDADAYLDEMDAKQREAEAAKKKSPRRRAR